MSFAYEREHSTLDALLTTPLRSSYILSGKLAGILRSSAFALAFPVLFTVLAWGREVISPRAVEKSDRRTPARYLSRQVMRALFKS